MTDPTPAETYGTRSILVDQWEAIDSAPDQRIGTRAKDRIAQYLNDGYPRVLWAPEWIIEESTAEPDDRHNGLYVEGVDRYSEKSHLVETPQGLEYFPLSQTIYFKKAPGADEIEPPQTGLSSFTNE